MKRVRASLALCLLVGAAATQARAQMAANEVKLLGVLAEEALSLFVAFGMTEVDATGSLYNTSVFLGPNGVIGKHRKKYLWDS